MLTALNQILLIIRPFSFSLIFLIIAAVFWQNRYEHLGVWFFSIFFLVMAFQLFIKAIKQWMVMNYQKSLRLRAEKVTDNFGRAGWATEKELDKAGLFNPNNGIPIGVYNGRPLFYSPIHALAVCPAGSGKTISIAIPSRCHGFRVNAGNNKSEIASCVIADLKGELAAQTKRVTTDLHGQEIFFLNPDGLFGLPSHRINPLQTIIDDVADEDLQKYALSDTKEIALQIHSEPPEGADKNIFFRNGTRSILIVIPLWLAAEHPEDCTLPTLFIIISNRDTLIEKLTLATESKALSGDIALLATGLLSTPEEQLDDFRTGALQSLETFAPSGPLADSVSASDFSFETLKQKSTAVYIMARFDRKDAYAPWIGLIANMAIKSLIRAGGNIPVHLLLDEATNFKLPGLANDLTALRGYGLRAHIICQAKSELIRAYGKESTETFYSQTDLKQFFGVASYSEAKEISDMLGNYTIKTENFGGGKTPWEQMKDGVSESGRPLLRPEEILRLSSSQQIIFIDKDGLPPILCERLPYNAVSPWHEWLDDNPIEGGKLPAQPTIHINYNEV